MDIRTTVGTRLAMLTSNIQSQSAAVAKYQEQISSSLRIQKASDAPGDFVSLIDYKARDARLQNFKGSVNAANLNLNDGVNALTEAGNILTQAHNLGLDGANGATDNQAAAAIATQVDSLLSRLVDVANTKSGDSYLFAGTATTTIPFSISAYDANGRPSAVAYAGSDEKSKGAVGQNLTVDTLYPGNAVFQSSAGDAFQGLVQLRDSLRDPTLTQSARSDAINRSLALIDSARGNVQTTMGAQASTLENLTAVASRIDDVSQNYKLRIGTLENTDYAEATIKLQEQQNAFQASLLVTSKIFDASLQNFIN